MGSPLTPRTPTSPFNRTAFAATHVVASPLLEVDPWQPAGAIDWDETLKYRHYLWDQGLHVAEAMDTAQRGMGLDWKTAKDLYGCGKYADDAWHIFCAGDWKNTQPNDHALNYYYTYLKELEQRGEL